LQFLASEFALACARCCWWSRTKTPGLWTLPDPWTPRTRPPVFARPREGAVSHNDHKPMLGGPSFCSCSARAHMNRNRAPSLSAQESRNRAFGGPT
jgi:hypothetical protein